MTYPFDTKNRAAALADRLALRLLLLLVSVGYFYILWRSPRESLLAGGALYMLVLLTLSLFERSTLARRDRALRERIGGSIALEDLLLMPGGAACQRVCALLCRVLDAEQTGPSAMRYRAQTWLVRCAQCASGTGISEGDVLAAHRARIEADAERCVLVSTGALSPAAIRAAEWVEPPIHLISGAQLAALFGREHPATDEEIARHARRKKTPFSFARMKALALSPAKLRRYLLCALLLLVFYLNTGSFICLASCVLSFLLALFCQKENSRVFRL